MDETKIGFTELQVASLTSKITLFNLLKSFTSTRTNASRAQAIIDVSKAALFDDILQDLDEATKQATSTRTIGFS